LLLEAVNHVIHGIVEFGVTVFLMDTHEIRTNP